ncbi:HlyD family efflux transporter periplasmic adaptor subunit [Sphingomonas parva]|uniref:HlyD family efflux transporter periplasmic adaptor subunit n=1 Tax=Sphingomonas parva TaxID=2555898 RepID=A0A4Y8ZUB4_9SPHN|nr:HlyD family efflux transporter periplasmic adaptor subunit [Sphingomonas parva]TFI59057.1 HlyD family efflux transporter periplasmic adaptor subunit [Sphingomonas parva]
MADVDPIDFKHPKIQAEVHIAPPAPKRLRSKRAKLLAGLALGVKLAFVGWFMLADGDHVATDNAYVNADSAQVTPLVAGAVAEVPVVNTQAVKRGDVLLRLDDADARLAVARAEADLVKARHQFAQTRATGGSLAAQIDARDADIGQAQAQLAVAQANLRKASADFGRRRALAESGAISGEELTTAQSAYSAAQGNFALARAAVRQAAATRGAARQSWAANQALVQGPVDTNPEVAAAKARLAQAKLDLARTVVRAPIDGVVTNRQVQVGQRIAAGAATMTIVPIGTAYVDANFKEGQLSRVRVGQPVRLVSDLYGSDVVYRGRVIGFSGGTGSAFALIPAQNATGNWIKVVQRLPVRIALDPADLRKNPLRVGLSMEAEIDVSKS